MKKSELLLTLMLTVATTVFAAGKKFSNRQHPRKGDGRLHHATGR